MRRLPFLCALMAAPLYAGHAAKADPIRHVIVIAMENSDSLPGDDDEYIYGGPSAPYLNTIVLKQAARADNFSDMLPLDVPSEAHYVMIEAGTNTFSDFEFGDDSDGNDDPSASRGTRETAHLTAQIAATNGRVTWRSYQEGISAVTGRCPIESDPATFYAAKHNPFVFFRDVTGEPPSKDNAYCAEHIVAYAQLKEDLAAGKLANYVFITPNLCHDMHDPCDQPNRVAAGDQWLESELPPILDYAEKHSSVVFIAWDEGHLTRTIPFLALGPHVRSGYRSDVEFDHRSIARTVERIFGLPVLDSVQAAHDLEDLFQPGSLP